MTESKSSLLFGSSGKSLEDRYYAEVRPHLYTRFGLKQQYGVRTGRTLAEHLDSAAQLVVTVSRLAELDEHSRRILVAAAVVHDLNKLDPDGRSVKTLARNRDFLRQQLAEAHVLTWVDNPEDLEIVRRLIERHSGHNISDGMAFLPEDPLINRMADMLRAGDLIDLGLTEERIHLKVSTELTAALKRPCQLFRVRLNEQRGYLSALLLESIDEVLQEQGLTPLCLYPDGTLFLGERWPQQDLLAPVTNRLNIKISNVFGGNLQALVNSTKDGIKIQDDALAQDETVLMQTLQFYLEKKRAKKLTDIQAEVTKREATAGPTALEAAREVGLRAVQNGDEFAVSECLKAAYLSYRELKLPVEECWKRIGQVAGLNSDQLQALNAFDGQYSRPIFAAAASLGLDAALKAVQDSLVLRRQQLNTEGGQQDSGAALHNYLARVVSWPQATSQDWQALLDTYIEAGANNRCSLGATEGEVSDLISANFPQGTKVQVFSNRLVGGSSREPKRRASQTAILDYQLLTVGANLPKGDAGIPQYIHFALPSASSPSLRAALKAWLMEQASVNPEGGPVSVDDIALLKKLEVYFKPNKLVGTVFPHHKGFVSNQVVLPLYWGKDASDSISLLRSLRVTLEMAVQLSLPFVLGTTLEIEETWQDFGRVAGIPASLQNLLMGGVYPGWSQARQVLQRLQALGQLAVLVCGDFSKMYNCLYELGCIASESNPLPIYGALLRWHLRTRDEQKYPFAFQVPHLSPILNQLMEDLHMPESSLLTSLLRRAASLAVQHHIRGSSWERTAIMEPVQHFLETVRQQKPHHDLDFLFADLTQRYHSRLDRIREHGVGQTKREQLMQYFGCLRQLYEGVYHGRPERLMVDEKSLGNAYLFFFHEANQAAKTNNREETHD